jgi:phage terminase large subunit-like protein
MTVPRVRFHKKGNSNSLSATGSLERWRNAPTAFIESYLCDPDTGKPYKLLPAERAFLKHALKVDSDGRLLYPLLVYSAPKKSGKTAFGAILVLTVILLYGGRFGEGYSCSNDLEQAMSRVFEVCKRIIEASPLLRASAKVSADRIAFPATHATITCLASDYASAAGGHPTIAIFDELWGYTSERAHRLWDELVPVPTRKISCRLVVTHAGFDGEANLLYQLYQRGLALPEVSRNLHAGDGMLMFWSHDPIAPWQDERWRNDMRRQLRPAQYLRMCENRFVSSEGSFIELDWWDACVDANASMLVSDKNLSVYCGVDAGIKHDATAIVACTWDHNSHKVKIVFHRIFTPSRTQPVDIESTIESTLFELKQRFHVRKILFDPWQLMSVSQRLTKAHLPMEEFPQTTQNITIASQNLYELIKQRNLVAYRDEQIRLAISRSVAIETPRGWKISKQTQSHKIDVVVALAMAAHAAVENGTPWFLRHAQPEPVAAAANGGIFSSGIPQSATLWATDPSYRAGFRGF